MIRLNNGPKINDDSCSAFQGHEMFGSSHVRVRAYLEILWQFRKIGVVVVVAVDTVRSCSSSSISISISPA